MAQTNEKINLLINAKDRTGGVLKRVQGQIIALVGAYAGLRLGQELFQGTVVAAVDYEKTMVSLRAVVKATGRDMNQVLSEMETHLGSLASKTQVAEGFLKGMTTTLDVDQISRMTQAVKEASLAMGEDFGRQLPLIIKAIKQLNPAILDNIGVTIRLDRLNKRIRAGYFGLNKEINEATQQHAIFIEIMQQTEQFQGQEEERLKTAAGQWQKLTTALADLGVSIGTVLVPALTSLLEPLAAVAGSFNRTTKATLDDVFAQSLQSDKIAEVVKRYRDGLIPTLGQFNKEMALAKMAKKEDSEELTAAEKVVRKYKIELDALVISQSRLAALPKVFTDEQKDTIGQQSEVYKDFQKKIDDLIESHESWLDEQERQGFIEVGLKNATDRAKGLKQEVDNIKAAMAALAETERIAAIVDPATAQATDRFLARLDEMNETLPEIEKRTGNLSKQLIIMGKVGENAMEGIGVGAKESLEEFETFGMEVTRIMNESLVDSTFSATNQMINQLQLLTTQSHGFFKQMGVNFVNEFIRRALSALVTSGLLRIFGALVSGGTSELTGNIAGGFTGGLGVSGAPSGGDSLPFAINNRQTNIVQDDRNLTGRSLVQFR